MTREEAEEREAERRAEARLDRDVEQPDRFGRDADWHYPRDLAPRGW